MEMNSKKINTYIRYVFLSFLIAFIAACNGGNSNNGGNNPQTTFQFAGPSEFPAGTDVNVPFRIINTGNANLTGVRYTIPANLNTTGAALTVTAASQAECATVAVGTRCTLFVHVPANSHPGSFNVVANGANSNSDGDATVGLTDLPPANTESGINGVALYYNPVVTLPANTPGVEMVTMVVNTESPAVYNTLDLVDESGNSIPYFVATGNSGNGMTAFAKGTVVVISAQISAGATQVSFKPVLKMNGVIVSAATAPFQIPVLRNGASGGTGSLSMLPGNFYIDADHPAQIMTLINRGNANATLFNITEATPIIVDWGNTNTTCKQGMTMAPDEECLVVLSYPNAELSNVAGTAGLTALYSNSLVNSDVSSTFTFAGRQAVANLLLSSPDNPSFNFQVSTANSTYTNTLTLTNRGKTDIESFTYPSLPSGYSISTASNNSCTASTVLAVNQSCNLLLTYNNNQVVATHTDSLVVNYKYHDVITPSQLHAGSSSIPVSGTVIQSQANLKFLTDVTDFGNILNNGAESTMNLYVTNTGEIATANPITYSTLKAPYSLVNSSANCAAPLAAGDTCIITIQSKITSSFSAGQVNQQFSVIYQPYSGVGVSSNTIGETLTTNVISTSSADIVVALTSLSANWKSGPGTSPTNQFQLVAGATGTLTYTITNNATSPAAVANNFALKCGGVACTGAALGNWRMVNNNCTNIAPNGGTCQVQFTLNSPTASQNNLSLPAISMTWTDQTSPNGATQVFAASPVYANVYQAPTVTFNPESRVLLPAGASTNIIAALSGGYNESDHTITINSGGTSGNVTVTSTPAPCVLSQTVPTCTFTISAATDAPSTSYQLPVNGSAISSIISNYQVNILGLNSLVWMGGAATTDASGVYGTKGIPSTSNIPSAREYSVSWTDANGNFWLFGGSSNSNYLNDLWRYNPSTGAWTWMSGSNDNNQAGIYGTKGMPAVSNVPGARSGLASWRDESGNLWLFGGVGLDSTGNYGYMNDLWKYNIASNQWEWVGGSNVIYQRGVYGTKGVPSASNIPGARYGQTSWTDSAGNFWLFGGYGYDSTVGNGGYLNDLWKYNPNTNQWTWVNGSNAIDQTGLYGTKGVESSANVPGARFRSAGKWVDSNGNLWLFGGWNNSVLNDLWRYNPTSGNWTWMGGSNTDNATGVYGIQGVESTTNIPGARNNAVAMTDSFGNFYLFGGWGYAASTFGYLNDLWKYNPRTGGWTWIRGANTVNAIGRYGTLGVAASSNEIGAREASIGFRDIYGDFWIFGGGGYASTSSPSYLNDLWKYNAL